MFTPVCQHSLQQLGTKGTHRAQHRHQNSIDRARTLPRNRRKSRRSSAPPLPQALFGAFHDPTPAIKLRIPLQGTTKVWAGISFATSAKTIILDWQYLTGTAPTGSLYRTENVSFLPTAVCPLAGAGTVFFVAGYDQRSGKSIIEQWDITNIAIGTTVPPGGGDPISTMSYQLNRTRLAATTTIGFIRGIACHFQTNELFVFTEGPPNLLWSLEIASGTWTLLHSDQDVPVLGDYQTYFTTLISTEANKPGFIVVGKPWRPWLEATPMSQIDADTDTLLVFRDENLDGIIDEIVELTWSDYKQRGYSDYFILSYN